ncbi:MAG: hypothetical protein HON53_03230 [Planctomycetaceae bacterium]|jgi:hypothetical protein|nr:hypothetical protein [Planctomycetaceae bacterium]MBT6155970.1 hypothetical protein [Planctomycetaceae bacterium]MBT6483115.1 hypothetical protein [Planctomycetaceae bacterium]MBT6494091.1 hypothetical protein [Planctomycetaceae bacterium]
MSLQKTTRSFVLGLVAFGCLLSVASAHYLWITIDKKTGENGTTNIYFEGGPGPGDGHYLDPFIERGTTWIRTIDTPKSAVLKVTETKKPGKRWLSAELPVAAPRVIDSYAMWGVYTYGKTEVLLHYYSKNVDVSTAAEMNKIARSDKLTFDVAPSIDGETVTCQATWKGKPAPNCKINIRGPKKFNVNLSTDEGGRITFTAKDKGVYRVSTKFEENESGTQDDKKYDLRRHHFRMLMTLPLAD